MVDGGASATVQSDALLREVRYFWECHHFQKCIATRVLCHRSRARKLKPSCFPSLPALSHAQHAYFSAPPLSYYLVLHCDKTSIVAQALGLRRSYESFAENVRDDGMFADALKLLGVATQLTVDVAKAQRDDKMNRIVVDRLRKEAEEAANRVQSEKHRQAEAEAVHVEARQRRKLLENEIEAARDAEKNAKADGQNAGKNAQVALDQAKKLRKAVDAKQAEAQKIQEETQRRIQEHGDQ